MSKTNADFAALMSAAQRPPPLPEFIGSEPRPRSPSNVVFAVLLLLRGVGVALLVVATLPLWPLYILEGVIGGWPPNVPRQRQVARYLRLAWTAPAYPGRPAVLARLWLTLSVVRKWATTPVWGLAWALDRVLYARELRETPVVAPLIEISAARSGSTQLARYLEDDPALIAPSFLQSVFPYLWLWRLSSITLGRVFTHDRVHALMERMLPPEFKERHEGDPFRTDTFEAGFYLGHLNHLAPFFGPQAFVDDFGFARPAPHNRDFWERDFVDFLDGIGRKTLIFSGNPNNGAQRRFFVKGHFLYAANALAARFPDASFLTLIREPAPRFHSAINYFRANPFDDTLGRAPWQWVVEGVLQTETDYCLVEKDWYSRNDGVRRHVVRFRDYVGDLEATMTEIYSACLDVSELPPHVPRKHPPRNRTNYLLNRSLAQLRVDEDALNRYLAVYVAWCRPTRR